MGTNNGGVGPIGPVKTGRVTFLEKGWPLNRKPEGVDHEDFCDPVLRRLCIDINIRHAGVWTMNNLPASAAIPLRIPIPQRPAMPKTPTNFQEVNPQRALIFGLPLCPCRKQLISAWYGAMVCGVGNGRTPCGLSESQSMPV